MFFLFLCFLSLHLVLWGGLAAWTWVHGHGESVFSEKSPAQVANVAYSVCVCVSEGQMAHQIWAHGLLLLLGPGFLPLQPLDY